MLAQKFGVAAPRPHTSTSSVWHHLKKIVSCYMQIEFYKIIRLNLIILYAVWYQYLIYLLVSTVGTHHSDRDASTSSACKCTPKDIPND